MAVLALPAGAQEATEGPTEAPTETLTPAAEPLSVSGRDSLVLPLPGQATAITVAVTDERDETATWTFEPVATDAGATPYAIDLETPDQGSAPVNGKATLTVGARDATLLEVPLTLDRDPAAPTVTVVNRFGNVTLLWDRITGPGPVTYRVQRAPVDGEWSTLSGAGSELRFTDDSVEPGRYRYRVNAAVPAARAGLNFSADALATVNVAPPATPEPPATPQPPAEEAVVAPPGTPQPPQAERTAPHRKVAVTGDIRRPVVERRVHRDSPVAPTLQPLRWTPRNLQRTVGGPAIAPPRPPVEDAPVVAPPVARFVPPPVALPPAGTLAVEAASATGLPTISPASWLAAAALGGMLLVTARRRRAELSLAPGGPR